MSQKPPDWIVSVVLPIVLAIIPELVRRRERESRVVCCACGAKAPDLPHETLANLDGSGIDVVLPSLRPGKAREVTTREMHMSCYRVGVHYLESCPGNYACDAPNWMRREYPHHIRYARAYVVRSPWYIRAAVKVGKFTWRRLHR